VTATSFVESRARMHYFGRKLSQ